jgi:hypothetical protein
LIIQQFCANEKLRFEKGKVIRKRLGLICFSVCLWRLEACETEKDK